MVKLTVQHVTDKGFRLITADLLELEAQQQSWQGLETEIAVLVVEAGSSRRRGSCLRRESTTGPSLDRCSGTVVASHVLVALPICSRQHSMRLILGGRYFASGATREKQQDRLCLGLR